MPAINLIQRLRQKKMDALVARNLHRPRVARFHRLGLLVDLLALTVPVGYFAVRYLAKDTSWMRAVEIIWELLAGLLLAMTIAKLVLKWQERSELHTNLMAKDIAFIAHIDYLLTLSHTGNISDDAINVFLLSADQDHADAAALVNVTATEKQMAYREALKEIEPSSTTTVCPECRASPWQYVPGICQLCGNTPT